MQLQVRPQAVPSGAGAGSVRASARSACVFCRASAYDSELRETAAYIAKRGRGILVKLIAVCMAILTRSSSG